MATTNKRTYPNNYFAWYNDDNRIAILTEQLSTESGDITTEKYDYKRGVCEVAANLKIAVKEVLALGEEADTVFLGWNISVRTKAGLLTLE